LLIALGVLGGLGLGLSLAGLLEFFDSTMRSDADVVQALALPALAIVPVIKPARRALGLFPFVWTTAPSIRNDHSLAEPAHTLLLEGDRFIPAPERFKGFEPKQARRLVVFPDVPADAIEQYRKLAAVLHHAQQHRQLRIVMIASAFPHEGKTL